MKRIKSIVIGALSVLFLTALGLNYIQFKNTKDTRNPGVDIVLNGLGVTGSNGDVTKVEVDCNEELFETEIPVYEVVESKTTEKELDKMLSSLKFGKMKKGKEGKTKTFSDNKGRKLFVNDDSGTIEYYSERIEQGKADNAIKHPLSDVEYKKRATDFIKKMDFNEDVYLKSIEPTAFIQEYNDNGEIVKRPIRYEVLFKKKPIDGFEFDGVGPGIKVEFDASGSIVSFLRIDKQLKKIDIELKSKNKNEIVDAVLNKDALISDIYGDNNKIKITKSDMALYSDPTQMKQKYMVPHYIFTAKNKGKNVNVIMPALKKKDYKVK